MFTIDQIKQAHSKVKSGADFPEYIREIKQLGVSAYETFVTDGHTIFLGNPDYSISTEIKYSNLSIVANSNAEQFIINIKAHQRGETDYPTFCAHCAESGIEKWVVNIKEMTCTYFDLEGKKVLIEQIPQ